MTSHQLSNLILNEASSSPTKCVHTAESMACGAASASGDQRSQAAPTVIDMMLLRRIAPALLLIVLAPLIAEFLLGDFTVRSLPLIFVLGWQYGGGALLIREVSRRLRRGWPTMLLLALAYGLIEEGFTTQSLFNPNYAGQRLLDYGFLPALGTSLNWCVYVLGLHVVWSIGTPILIAEGVSADRRETPWLHRPGLAVTAVAFVLGCALTTFFTLISDPFVASLPQLIVTGGLVIAAVAAACVVKPDFPGTTTFSRCTSGLGGGRWCAAAGKRVRRTTEGLLTAGPAGGCL